MINIIIGIIKEIKPYEQILEMTELVNCGILDSLSILSLVTQLEEEFDIVISDEAVRKDNFATVIDIVQLVQKSRANNEEVL